MLSIASAASHKYGYYTYSHNTRKKQCKLKALNTDGINQKLKVLFKNLIN